MGSRLHPRACEKEEIVLTTIVSFIIILLVLILVHEFGHFISAKIFKIKVEEFGIFLPPRIAGFKRGETIYSINALPLGGFVKLAGEEDPDELTKKGEQKEFKKSENTDGQREVRVTTDRIGKQSKFGYYSRAILWLPASRTEGTSPKKVGRYFNPLDPFIWDKNYHIVPTDVDDEDIASGVPTQVSATSRNHSGHHLKPESGTLAGKSIPVRLITLGAGSLMNLLLPFLLLSLAFIFPHQAVASDIFKDNGEVIVVQIAPSSPALEAGIEVNDTILSVNGEQILNVDDYERLIGENLGKEITIAIKHSDATTAEVVLTPRTQSPEGEGATGVAITTVITKSYPFWQAITRGVSLYWDILVSLKDGIVQSIKGTIPFDVTGPVGIAQVVGKVARTGISNLLILTSLISINLGIVNIFPIPALDGGRIVFVLLEWVRRGKRVSPKTEQLVHSIGMALLLALILLITYRDITRIISG